MWIPDELCLGSPDTEGGGGGDVTCLNYQAVHTGVFVGIAKNALEDAVEFDTAELLSLHNPLDFKLMHAGDYLLNGTLPPVDSYN